MNRNLMAPIINFRWYDKDNDDIEDEDLYVENITYLYWVTDVIIYIILSVVGDSY